MKVLVMGGLGKVGSAIADALKNTFEVHVLDVSVGSDSLNFDFLHVCIPYTNDFINNVREAMTRFKVKKVIVHSTVPVGTTKIIGETAAHSPILGQHDDLGMSIFKFPKWLGVVNPLNTFLFVDHLNSAGFNVKTMANSNATELCKLLCLSRYLNDLAFYENAEKVLNKNKVNPAEFIKWMRGYNEGYAGTRFIRPELSFPKGKVGGECVLQNSFLLDDEYTKKNLKMFVGEKK